LELNRTQVLVTSGVEFSGSRNQNVKPERPNCWPVGGLVFIERSQNDYDTPIKPDKAGQRSRFAGERTSSEEGKDNGYRRGCGGSGGRDRRL
jgi:hypothetical protein